MVTHAVSGSKELFHVLEENGASVSATLLIPSLFTQCIKGIVLMSLFSVLLKTLPTYSSLCISVSSKVLVKYQLIFYY